MPLYEYTCNNGHIKKEIRSIHSKEPTDLKCEQCGEPLRQVIGGIAVKFNGQGFYTTDKRNR